MITLATTLGCLLLLPNPQPQGNLFAIALQAQESAPTQNPPEQSPAPTQPAPDKTEQTAPESTTPAAVSPQKPTTKTSARKKRTAKKKPQPSESSIVVIRNGGSSDTQGQISYSATDQQTLEKRKNTDALLNATAINLKQISEKQLNPDQQDMVKQIHNYMARSKDATKNGDIQGANNLATKANLLSKELVKP